MTTNLRFAILKEELALILRTARRKGEMRKRDDVRSCLWNLPSSLDSKIDVTVARNFVSLFHPPKTEETVN